jgi:hypothetical protein
MNRLFKYSIILSIICCTWLPAETANDLAEPSVNYDDFKLLPISDQIEIAWQLYYSTAVTPFDWATVAIMQRDSNISSNYIKIINESTETEKIREIVFERLNLLNTINFLNSHAYSFLSNFFVKHVTNDEEGRRNLLALFRKKLCEQLIVYKLIDPQAMNLDKWITSLNGEQQHEYTVEDGRNGEIYFYNKYTAMGFKDLRYDEWLREGYIRLSPEQQINHIWNEWKKYTFRAPISPFLIEKIILLMERREETIPLLYDYLKNTREEEAARIGNRNMFGYTIETLYVLIRRECLNQDEKKELAFIYQQKNDEYIKNYGQVTDHIIKRYMLINYLNGGMWSTGESADTIADKLIAEYKKLGYFVIKRLYGQ